MCIDADLMCTHNRCFEKTMKISDFLFETDFHSSEMSQYIVYRRVIVKISYGNVIYYT